MESYIYILRNISLFYDYKMFSFFADQESQKFHLNDWSLYFN